MSKQPIEAQYRDAMNAIAEVLSEALEGQGFALLVFDFGDKGRMNYISNARREDMIVAMKEFISRSEFGDQPEQEQ